MRLAMSPSPPSFRPGTSKLMMWSPVLPVSRCKPWNRGRTPPSSRRRMNLTHGSPALQSCACQSMRGSHGLPGWVRRLPQSLLVYAGVPSVHGSRLVGLERRDAGEHAGQPLQGHGPRACLAPSDTSARSSIPSCHPPALRLSQDRGSGLLKGARGSFLRWLLLARLRRTLQTASYQCRLLGSEDRGKPASGPTDGCNLERAGLGCASILGA